ncbi:hypothetical protein M3201_13670 [Paenibacillus motobuensis]|uniref:hypothetical protein n=1 Tax=Paenibacillus TaxID=44249 RepID=UPI00203DFE8E|nr:MULTISPECIES: hypothetical protein [Paenibacillus]MCM3040747.1 hypothetical protein [Paenibacillus lutimineralis]MCM3647851.1 hypothetical protein [Paenibacillus motobuensis]
MATQKIVKQAVDLETGLYQLTETHKAITFSKAQFLASQAYSGVQKDILSVVLKDGQRYTKAEAEVEINQFKHKGVK